MKAFFQFVFAILVSFVPGILGMLVTPVASHTNFWFNTLNQSVLTPAPWVFSVVWFVLYFLLGIALFLVIRNNHTKISKVKAFALFAIQLFLNFLWSVIFFGLHIVGGALFVVVLLLLFSIWMLRAFYPISKTASYLVWPYVLWLCLATYMNAMILYLN